MFYTLVFPPSKNRKEKEVEQTKVSKKSKYNVVCVACSVMRDEILRSGKIKLVN